MPTTEMARKAADASCNAVRSLYEKAHPGKGVGIYSDQDWERLRTALALAADGSVVDIGVGNGALLHMLLHYDPHRRVAGIDIAPHERLILPPESDYQTMSVVDMAFHDDEFDTVICMEVLEHLENEDLAPAIAELRRVARRRLVVTVPFDEPLPLWWHDKPGGHRQQFSPERILELFPRAFARFQKRSGVDWIFLVEDPSGVPELPMASTVLKAWTASLWQVRGSKPAPAIGSHEDGPQQALAEETPEMLEVGNPASGSVEGPLPSNAELAAHYSTLTRKVLSLVEFLKDSHALGGPMDFLNPGSKAATAYPSVVRRFLAGRFNQEVERERLPELVSSLIQILGNRAQSVHLEAQRNAIELATVSDDLVHFQRRVQELEKLVRVHEAALAVKSGQAQPRRVWEPLRDRVYRALESQSRAKGVIAADATTSVACALSPEETRSLASSLSRRTAVKRPPLPIRIAAIADQEFFDRIGPDCSLYRLTPNRWRIELEEREPGFLVLDPCGLTSTSPWLETPDSEPTGASPLLAMLEHCRKVSIPTVVWQLRWTGSEVSRVSIPHQFSLLAADSSIARAHLEEFYQAREHLVLSSATQPQVYNPINSNRVVRVAGLATLEPTSRGGAEEQAHSMLCAGAGSLELRRIRVLTNDETPTEVCNTAQPISDEVHNASSDEQALLYRAYPLFLDCSSLPTPGHPIGTPLLDCLASGTPVLSSYSAQLEETFGEDCIPMPLSPEEVATETSRMLTDTVARERLLLRAQRRIFGKENYRARIHELCTRLEMSLPSESHRVSVVTATIRKDFVDNLLGNFARQSISQKELVVVINEGKELTEAYIRERAEALGVENCEVLTVGAGTTLGACLNQGILQGTGDVFAKMDDDDYYGEHYLEDSLLALDYSGSDCVGKASYFTYAEGPDKMYIRSPGQQHVPAQFVIGTTLVGYRSLLPEISFANTRVGEDTIFLKRLLSAGKRLYSHSQYNYIKLLARNLDHHTWKIAEKDFLSKADFFADSFRPELCCF